MRKGIDKRRLIGNQVNKKEQWWEISYRGGRARDKVMNWGVKLRHDEEEEEEVEEEYKKN